MAATNSTKRGQRNAEWKSAGGGCGALKDIEGDVPICLFTQGATSSGGGTRVYKRTPPSQQLVSRTKPQVEVNTKVSHHVHRLGKGGGTGIYQHVPRYFPGEALRGEKTQQTNEKQSTKYIAPLAVLSFNAAGMSEETFADFLISAELASHEWDAIMIQEGPTNNQLSQQEVAGGTYGV